MMCYMDKTFCPFFLLCKKGYTCGSGLTEDVKQAATMWWGKEGAPIMVYSEFPECFVPFFALGDDNKATGDNLSPVDVESMGGK